LALRNWHCLSPSVNLNARAWALELVVGWRPVVAASRGANGVGAAAVFGARRQGGDM
jgi:hypothetical protein